MGEGARHKTETKGEKRHPTGVRIIVKPVYVGSRPMAEVIGNAVAENLKNSKEKNF